MPSAFKSKDLFGSGPHRFTQGRQGHLMLSWLALGQVQPGTVALGLTELDVVVTGRLVAPDEATLDALRSAIAAELEESPTPGSLEDGHGREWTEMTFIDFREGDRVDRGRVVSLAYGATFRRIREY